MIKKKNPKKIILKILIPLIIIILLLSVILIIKKLNNKITTYTTDTKMYQYFGEQRFDYTTKLTLNKDNSITKLLVDNKEVILSSDPFYYKDSRKILLPTDMSIIIPSSNLLQKQLPFFSILDGEKIDTYVVKNNNKIFIDDAIIYDGNDLYIFPFTTTLKIDNENIELSPFSYVIVNYTNKTCFYYDYEKEYAKTFENVKEDVIATNNSYKLNLSIDSIDNNGKQRLLMKEIKYLDSFFK